VPCKKVNLFQTTPLTVEVIQFEREGGYNQSVCFFDGMMLADLND
jgi:hypothetical protein